MHSSEITRDLNFFCNNSSGLEDGAGVFKCSFTYDQVLDIKSDLSFFSFVTENQRMFSFENNESVN